MDFLVATCNSKRWLEQVNFCKLWDCKFCIAVPKHHVLSKKDKLSWANVHPSFVFLPVDWNFVTPYVLLYTKEPSADIKKFVKLTVEQNA